MVKVICYGNIVHPQRFQPFRPRAVAAAIPPVVQTFRRAVLFAAVLVVWCLMCASYAAAQPSPILFSPEANRLYEQLLDNPTDRSLNLKYSTLMSRGGDFEAAIPPLERLLVSNPKDAWLMLQLGTLYSALGSKTMAATYLQQALNEPTAGADVLSKASQLLNTL